MRHVTITVQDARFLSDEVGRGVACADPDSTEFLTEEASVLAGANHGPGLGAVPGTALCCLEPKKRLSFQIQRPEASKTGSGVHCAVWAPPDKLHQDAACVIHTFSLVPPVPVGGGHPARSQGLL